MRTESRSISSLKKTDLTFYKDRSTARMLKILKGIILDDILSENSLWITCKCHTLVHSQFINIFSSHQVKAQSQERVKRKPGGVLALKTTVPRTGHGCVIIFSGLRKFVLRVREESMDLLQNRDKVIICGERNSNFMPNSQTYNQIPNISVLYSQ